MHFTATPTSVSLCMHKYMYDRAQDLICLQRNLKRVFNPMLVIFYTVFLVFPITVTKPAIPTTPGVVCTSFTQM